MTSPTNKLDIVVGPFPADAALWDLNGVRTLMLREGQSFSSARDNVRNVLPGITVEAAERMIREQCPEFRDLDDLLGVSTPAPPSVERPPVEMPADDVAKGLLAGRRRRNLALIAAILPALTASWALGRYVQFGDSDSTRITAAAPDVSPSASPSIGAMAAPFRDSKFEFFAGSNDIECATISPLAAECTDADGMVMSTKAATGPDSTIFTFSYGSERIGLRIFYDSEYADTWARQDGSQGMYPNIKRHGRYVLWGTDMARIDEYKLLLEKADRDRSRGPGPGPAMASGPSPLPSRLAALTLGTLGITKDAVRDIIANVSSKSEDGPAMMAARLVLGLGSSPGVYEPADDDIVALAAGIETPPTTETSTTESPTEERTFPPTSPTRPPTTDPSPTPSTPVTPSEPTPTPPVTPPPTTPPAPLPPTSPPPTTPPPPTAETPKPTPPTPVPTPVEPAPSTPTPPAPPAGETPEPDPSGEEPAPGEETPAPPGEETPAPPGDETPPPAEETPVEVPQQPDESAPAPDDQGDDLLILDSAWTVAA
ncbi:hypothetical protein ABTY59_31865 [Streptomyces sp. NPDC096079]|uniref:hypothetical protein n=1 Tax=Streptomyces sp. NPDC096079 TaxID=3155820 RepID=UPI00331FBDF4